MKSDSFNFHFGDWTFRVEPDDRSWKEAIEEVLVLARDRGGEERCIRRFHFGDGSDWRHIRNFCRKFATDRQYRQRVLDGKMDWTPWMKDFWDRCWASSRALPWDERLEMQRRLYFQSKKDWQDRQKALAAAFGKAIAEALDKECPSGCLAVRRGGKRWKWTGVRHVRWTKDGRSRSSIKGRLAPLCREPLTPEQRATFRGLEQTVKRHLARYLECGRALVRIRDERLYRETHRTFEAYCIDRFGVDRTYAYRFIDAAAAADNVDQWSTKKERPANERQARPLALLAEPKDQAEAWDKAVDSAQSQGLSGVPGRIVEEVVLEKLGRGGKAAPGPKGIDDYPFSLGGVKVKFTGRTEDSPDSVQNVFLRSADDMDDLLTRAGEVMDADARRMLREQVRRKAEALLAKVERTEWSDYEPLSAEERERKLERIMAARRNNSKKRKGTP